MNSSLLRHDIVKSELSRLIKMFWQKALNEENYGKNWELLKFELGKYLRRYGSELAKSRRRSEEEIISNITTYTMRSDTLSDEDKLKFIELQKNLDDLYKRKAEGAFVRSRLKWLEHGEQMSSYFF